MIIYVLDWVENIAGKRENAGYQHFSFPTMFSKSSLSPCCLKSELCVVKSKSGHCY